MEVKNIYFLILTLRILLPKNQDIKPSISREKGKKPFSQSLYYRNGNY